MSDQTKASKPKFTKSQLVTSKKYVNKRDLLNALLEDDKLYTSEEIEKIISNYLKKEVD